jgi:hypothetical protein
MRSSRRFVEIKSAGHDTVSKNPGKRKEKVHFAEADRKNNVKISPQRLVFERKNGDEPFFPRDQVRLKWSIIEASRPKGFCCFTGFSHARMAFFSSRMPCAGVLNAVRTSWHHHRIGDL